MIKVHFLHGSAQSCKKVIIVRYPEFQLQNVWITCLSVWVPFCLDNYYLRGHRILYQLLFLIIFQCNCIFNCLFYLAFWHYIIVHYLWYINFLAHFVAFMMMWHLYFQWNLIISTVDYLHIQTLTTHLLTYPPTTQFIEVRRA